MTGLLLSPIWDIPSLAALITGLAIGANLIALVRAPSTR